MELLVYPAIYLIWRRRELKPAMHQALALRGQAAPSPSS
jgi:hypothetical protein